MKKAFSVIIKDENDEQIALNLFNSTTIDIAKRISRNLCKAYNASSFYLYDLSDTTNGDISNGKLILHG